MADDARPPGGNRPPRDYHPDQSPDTNRAPRDYRPDVRPMLILVGLLLAVVVAWLFVSPLILPAA